MQTSVMTARLTIDIATANGTVSVELVLPDGARLRWPQGSMKSP